MNLPITSVFQNQLLTHYPTLHSTSPIQAYSPRMLESIALSNMSTSYNSSVQFQTPVLAMDSSIFQQPISTQTTSPICQHIDFPPLPTPMNFQQMSSGIPTVQSFEKNPNYSIMTSTISPTTTNCYSNVSPSALSDRSSCDSTISNNFSNVHPSNNIPITEASPTGLQTFPFIDGSLYASWIELLKKQELEKEAFKKAFEEKLKYQEIISQEMKKFEQQTFMTITSPSIPIKPYGKKLQTSHDQLKPTVSTSKSQRFLEIGRPCKEFERPKPIIKKRYHLRKSQKERIMLQSLLLQAQNSIRSNQSVNQNFSRNSAEVITIDDEDSMQKRNFGPNFKPVYSNPWSCFQSIDNVAIPKQTNINHFYPPVPLMPVPMVNKMLDEILKTTPI